MEEPLTIYTKTGCPACKKAKLLCIEKNICYFSKLKKGHEKEVEKVAPGYSYVPVIVDSKGKFLGGYTDLEKILSK